jgi:hypothetical protein
VALCHVLGAFLCALLCVAQARADAVEGDAWGDLTPAPMTPPRVWFYRFEQRPMEGSAAARDESIARRYVVQWMAQPPIPALNPDEVTVRVIERGGPLPPATRLIDYALWPSCLRGPLPTLPQACASGDGGEWELDGQPYPFVALHGPRQAIFWSPTLGILEDAYVDDDGVMTSRRLIGYDLGHAKGGDTTPATACDWRSSQRVKGGEGVVKLVGAHGDASAALRCAASPIGDRCEVTLAPSGRVFGVGPYQPSALKVWSDPSGGVEVVLIQAATETRRLMWALLLTPDRAEPWAFAYAAPSTDAAFSALMMQRDHTCTLQARLKEGDLTRVDTYEVLARGLFAVGEGSLRPLDDASP